MGFTAPLGLIALLGIPAVLILHLYRRRFEIRTVAGLFLFAPDGLPADAGPTRSRLLRTPSLWLELLAALLFALWLAGFYVGSPSSAPHLVVVLDDSASMAARSPSSDVAAEVRDWVRERIDAVGDANGVVTLITTGRRPQVLVGPRASPRDALSSLAAWRPVQPSHDPAAAWGLAADLAGPGAELVFITDRERPAPPPAFRHVALGVSQANAGIVGARRLRQGEETRVYADLMSWAEAPQVVEAVLEAVAPDGTRELARERITLAPRRASHVAWTVPSGDVAFRVRLSEDALALDNEVLLVPEPQPVVQVHLAMSEDEARQLRLARALASLPEAEVTDEPQQARLRIATAAGRIPPRGVELLIRAPGEARDDWIGPFLLERAAIPGDGDHAPLLDGVSLEGVVWSAGRGPLTGLPLVLAGEQVLLAERRASGGRRVHMNLDPTRSNLATSPDWPIFLSNLLGQVRGQLPGPTKTNVRIGGEIAYRFEGPSATAGALVLEGPDGRRHPARGVRLLTWEATRPGLHVLRQGERQIARYAAHFVDLDESDLREAGRRDEAAKAVAAPPEAAARAPAGEREALWLALLLLAAVVADGFVVGRRT